MCVYDTLVDGQRCLAETDGSLQSVCSPLTTVGNSRTNDVDLVTQTNDAVSACPLFHLSRHLLLSLMAGEDKRMPLKCRTPPAPF